MEERYMRQLILPEIGEEGQKHLAQAKVLIVGVGGLGSPIALYLAGAGVGTIGLVDDDVVSITNLHRQVLYETSQVGASKAEEARRKLLRLNPDLAGEVKAYSCRLTAENAEALISEYDIIVDGCDNFATRYLIDSVCASLKKPFVHGAIRELSGLVSVFHYTDPATQNLPTPQKDYSFRDLFPSEEAMLRLPPPPKGVVGIVPGVIGLIEAGEVLKLICGYGEVLSGKLWTIDFCTLQSNLIEL